MRCIKKQRFSTSFRVLSKPRRKHHPLILPMWWQFTPTSLFSGISEYPLTLTNANKSDYEKQSILQEQQ